jgi:hypothetical protein
MNVETIMKFIRAINSHDIKKIAGYMSENHIFINSHGKKIVGKENMKEGWKEYFGFFPDYTIEISEVIEDEELLALFGWAQGTYLNQENIENTNCWKLPCAWKAIVREDKVELWQVFSDTKVPYEIIEKNL